MDPLTSPRTDLGRRTVPGENRVLNAICGLDFEGFPGDEHPRDCGTPYVDRDSAVKRADEATARLAAEKAAEAKAAAASAVDSTVKAAAAALRAGRTNDVITPLEKALETEGPGPRAAEMHYLIGMAYSKGNQLDKSASHLSAAVAGDVADEDARY